MTAPLTSYPAFQRTEVDSVMSRTLSLTLKTTETYYFAWNSNTMRLKKFCCDFFVHFPSLPCQDYCTLWREIVTFPSSFSESRSVGVRLVCLLFLPACPTRLPASGVQGQGSAAPIPSSLHVAQTELVLNKHVREENEGMRVLASPPRHGRYFSR